MSTPPEARGIRQIHGSSRGAEVAAQAVQGASPHETSRLQAVRLSGPAMSLDPLRPQGANVASTVGGRSEDLAFDLHDGPSQLFLAIHLLAKDSLKGLSSDGSRLSRLAELAKQGKWEIDQIARGILGFPHLEGELFSALDGLARSFQADSGICTVVRVSGEPGRLQLSQAAGLYRVAHIALMNAWRHSHAAAISLQLRVDQRRASLQVNDDGIGLGQRWNHRGTRMGITSMRRTMAALGGTCRLRNLSPRGLSVQARIPQESS